MWADLGFWGSNGDTYFHIHGVTGPDEYTTVVNDNLFTNVMARYNLRRAAAWVDYIQETAPEAYERMAARLELKPAEVEEWVRCGRGMCIPFDDTLGIHPQDSHFLEREVWDLQSPATAKRPLLLHYHPLVIYRFQVLKQADVVLALFLQGQHFTAEQKRKDFEYYDPITTGDSTLSAVVQSIIAAEVGYDDLALRTSTRGSTSTWPTCTAIRPTACMSPRRGASGAPLRSASVACATTVAGSASIRDCRSRGMR